MGRKTRAEEKEALLGEDDDMPVRSRDGQRGQRGVSRRMSQWLGLDGEVDEYTSPEARAALRARAGRGGAAQGGASETEPFYHGPMTQDAAERRLKVHGMADGLFLIREGTRSLALALCYKGRVDQTYIDASPGAYRLECPGQRQFRTLRELVANYSQQAGALPCRLLVACPQSNSITGMREQAPQAAEEGLGGGATPRSASPKLRPERKGKLKARDRASVQRKLAELPTFKPYFIQLVTFLQLLVLVIEIGLGGMAHIGFEPEYFTEDVQVGLEQSQVESVTASKPSNMFIGPPTAWLVKHGANYAPCMRKDIAVFAAIAKQNEQEQSFGCCTSTDGLRCGMTSPEDCESGNFDPNPCPTGVGSCVYLRPCCVSFDGQCRVTTRAYCDFVYGVWNADSLDCSSTSCLKKTCGLTMKNPNRPAQWYRLFTSIFLHAGIIHGLVVIYLQQSLGNRVEAAAGWLRVALIYLISGIGGNIFSAVFSAGVPQVGATGALYGLLAVTVVDLFQSWQLIERPWRRFTVIMLQTLCFLMIGTLPWVDNFSHVGGFLFGTLSAIVFLPYITFGTWDALRKRCLLLLCLPLLVVSMLVLLVVFYEVQGTDFCPNCKYIDCVPYTSEICKNVEGDRII
eukprot:m.61175 g.61175  ORF g.61175 m.61175 type:complete len:628 (-) comp13188_c0_seq1:140-2023(-)